MRPGESALTSGALLVLAPSAVALILAHLHSKSGRVYVRSWSLAFLCAVVARLAIALLLAVDTPRAVHAALSAAAGAATYLQAAALLWGCLEAARQGRVTIVESVRLLAAVALTGAVAGLVPFLVGGTAGLQRFFALAMQSLLMALVFAVAAIALRRGRGDAFLIPALTFGGYAGIQLYEGILVAGSITSGAAMPLRAIVGAELLASVVVLGGVAMAIFEDERRAATDAVSRAEHLAHHDTLTGLPNRALFADRLAVALSHAQRHRHKLAVIFVDLDRFKQVNDSLGHRFGDELLRAAAVQMRGAIRDEDTVARFGGDEFAILIHMLGRAEHAGKIAQKVLSSLALPMTVEGREFVVTASAGIAVYPTDGVDGETLMRNADTAMYRSKQRGRNTYEYYAAAMNRDALESLELENDLRRALANNELVLHYQPLIDLESGSVFGIEALLRWQHPTRGLIMPDRFIPAAEQSGLIVPIGRWVLMEACKQAVEWHRRGRKVIVAVNLSARQFSEPDLIDDVRNALETSGLRPQFLELEITEGNAMHDVEKAIEILQQMKALGVRISIDDFGTGYSCLSYLKRFPIDTLKLDRSFVRDITTIEDAQIALGVIALAHSLRLKVIAEGVETLGQLQFLREHSCDRLQGYLFSRPLPAAKCEQFMLQNHALKIA